MSERYIIDYVNPDAGVGHSIGLINQALKISIRNNVALAFSETQLQKPSSSDLIWRLKKIRKILSGKKPNETHNLSNDLNYLFALSSFLPDRVEIEKKVSSGALKLIRISPPNIPIPSNSQNDDSVYAEIDALISKLERMQIALKLENRDYGDYEYCSTRDWFINAYTNARLKNPIPLSYQKDRLNIAVHIRRGDLLPGRQFSDLSDRMLPDSWYIEVINSVLESINRKFAIHIFSEGANGLYHSELGIPCKWNEYFPNTAHEIHELIDTSFTSTFHHLIEADILIGSKSGMTHLAAMLSNNIKIVPRMWHSYRGTPNVLELSEKDVHPQKIIAEFLQKLGNASPIKNK